MKRTRLMSGPGVQAILACSLSCLMPLFGAEPPASPEPGSPAAATAPASTSGVSEIEQLKQMLLEQQRQINELKKALLGANGAPAAPAPRASEGSQAASTLPASQPDTPHPSIGEVASTTGILPRATAPAPIASPFPQGGGAAEQSSPMQLKIGDAYITPVGFMDMTLVSRSTNPGSGIGTNFGSIPYGNTQTGSLSETRLSIQNSRLGARFDSIYHGWNVLGYWESDFLGQLGNPPNGGLAVSSNPYVMRLRLYWVDLTKGKFEFLAGQSWSLMTPNRAGISPLPGNVFFSQDIDVNYQLGLVWGRIPGYRIGFHPSKKVAFGLALENSEPYVGGGNGGSAIVAPTAIAGILGGQVNNGSSVISAAALHPDIIAKLAFDPTSKFHLEIAGVEVTNKIANPASTPAFQTSTKAGGGGSINLNFQLAKGLRIVTNNFWSAGAGRYIFGQAPDFMIRSNGTMSLVHSASTVSGFEYTAGKTLYYAYYGGVYISRNMALDANGTTKIGYGSIASDGQNRAIQEITFGTNTTLMRDPKWGAINLMFQYSYLQRNPWLVTGTAPTNAHLDMGFFNLRYTLPGAAPALPAAK